MASKITRYSYKTYSSEKISHLTNFFQEHPKKHIKQNAIYWNTKFHIKTTYYTQQYKQMQLDNNHRQSNPSIPAHSPFQSIFFPNNSYENYSSLHWTDYINQTVHWWLLAGFFVIKIWLNRDKNTKYMFTKFWLPCQFVEEICCPVLRICWARSYYL